MLVGRTTAVLVCALCRLDEEVLVHMCTWDGELFIRITYQHKATPHRRIRRLDAWNAKHSWPRRAHVDFKTNLSAAILNQDSESMLDRHKIMNLQFGRKTRPRSRVMIFAQAVFRREPSGCRSQGRSSGEWEALGQWKGLSSAATGSSGQPTGSAQGTAQGSADCQRKPASESSCPYRARRHLDITTIIYHISSKWRTTA